VKDGKISGIVDWETAGWYPEWWEYTKCHFGIYGHKKWLEVIEEILPGYQNELEAERELWKFVNPWG